MPKYIVYSSQVWGFAYFLHRYPYIYIWGLLYPAVCVACLTTITLVSLKKDVYFEVPLTVQSPILPVNWVYASILRLVYLSHNMLGLYLNYERHEPLPKLTISLIFKLALLIVFLSKLGLYVGCVLIIVVWLSTPFVCSNYYEFFNQKLHSIYYAAQPYASCAFYVINEGRFICNLK